MVETHRVFPLLEKIAGVNNENMRFITRLMSCPDMPTGCHEPTIRKLWTLKEGEIYHESYPDTFVAMVRREGYFANLSGIGVQADPNEETRTVDVTLKFLGAAMVSQEELDFRRNR